MNIKIKLFLVMSIVFAIFMAFIWFYSHSLSEEINEKGASIGFALFFKDEATHDEICNQADSAMFAAKMAGRNWIFNYGSLPC